MPLDSPHCHPDRPMRAARVRVSDGVRGARVAFGMASVGIAVLLIACSTGAGPLSSPSPLVTAEPSRAAVEARATEVPAPTPSATPVPTATPEPDWTKAPQVALDAEGIAAQLVMADAAIHDPSVTGAKLVWMGWLQQLAIGQLADATKAFRDGVLAGTPERVRTMVEGTIAAGKELRAMSTVIPKSLPDWKIVDAAPPDELLTYYKQAEAEFGVAWQYLAAIHLVETRMGRIRGLSSAGAQGPMQFIPSTWRAYGKGDVNDNHDAIMAAGRYLKAAGAPGNMEKALYAYNHSQLYVNALLAYAEVMKADPAAYRGYHGWQVYYPTKDGPVLLYVGWTKPD